jgi:hypothetical protein
VPGIYYERNDMFIVGYRMDDAVVYRGRGGDVQDFENAIHYTTLEEARKWAGFPFNIIYEVEYKVKNLHEVYE